MESKNVLITLCGRGGSKGLPNKNILPVNGKPLIVYSLEHAREFAHAVGMRADIELSTDSSDILQVMMDFGFKTDYKRPLELGDDTVGKIDVLRHLKSWKENKEETHYDYLLDLDITSPLRTITDLNQAFQKFRESDALNMFSVSIADRNPYFNMVELNQQGYAELCKPIKQNIKSRQTAPKVYSLNASFYFYREQFFQENYETVFTDRSMIFELNHECFDIDSKKDYLFMDYLVRNNLLGIKI
jgi:CMP-N,N'-diacetyllegionaminic acid synthase